MITLLPTLVFAQANTGTGFLDNWTRLVRFALSSLFPIVVSISGIIFMVQVIRFITTQDTAKRDALRSSVLWNLGILLVILTFFGLIKIATGIFGLQIGTDIGAANATGTMCTRETIRGIFMCIIKFISGTLIPTAVTLMALFFMGNMAFYLSQTDNETERTKARNYIFWALIGLAIVLTMFSILNIGTQTLFGSGSFVPQFPTSK